MVTRDPRADRARRRAREAGLRELAAMMRERGGMPAVPEPPPLHRMAAAAKATTTTERTP